MLSRIASGLAVLAFLLGPAGLGHAAPQDQPRQSAIVGGKRIQPRADEFSGPNAAPDVPPADAKDLDSLYNKILRDSTEPLGSSGGGANPAAPQPGPEAPKPR